MLEEVEPVEMAYGEVTRRVRVRAESIAPDPSPHEGDRREERPGRRGRVPRLGERDDRAARREEPAHAEPVAEPSRGEIASRKPGCRSAWAARRQDPAAAAGRTRHQGRKSAVYELVRRLWPSTGAPLFPFEACLRSSASTTSPRSTSAPARVAFRAGARQRAIGAEYVAALLRGLDAERGPRSAVSSTGSRSPLPRCPSGAASPSGPP